MLPEPPAASVRNRAPRSGSGGSIRITSGWSSSGESAQRVDEVIEDRAADVGLRRHRGHLALVALDGDGREGLEQRLARMGNLVRDHHPDQEHADLHERLGEGTQAHETAQRRRRARLTGPASRSAHQSQPWRIQRLLTGERRVDLRHDVEYERPERAPRGDLGETRPGDGEDHQGAGVGEPAR